MAGGHFGGCVSTLHWSVAIRMCTRDPCQDTGLLNTRFPFNDWEEEEEACQSSLPVGRWWEDTNTNTYNRVEKSLDGVK